MLALAAASARAVRGLACPSSTARRRGDRRLRSRDRAALSRRDPAARQLRAVRDDRRHRAEPARRRPGRRRMGAPQHGGAVLPREYRRRPFLAAGRRHARAARPECRPDRALRRCLAAGFEGRFRGSCPTAAPAAGDHGQPLRRARPSALAVDRPRSPRAGGARTRRCEGRPVEPHRAGRGSGAGGAAAGLHRAAAAADVRGRRTRGRRSTR